MPRTIVYSREILRAMARPPGDGPIAANDTADSIPDGYLSKLVKYVPAETVAFVAAISAVDLSLLVSWGVVVTALIGSVIYIRLRAPQPWFALVLTCLATALWVIGTTDFSQDLLGLSYGASRVLLAIGVFLIPGIDGLITQRYKSRLG